MQFLGEFRLDIRIPRNQVASPGERDGRGLVAGQEKRHHFVAQLRVAHRISVSVARPKQHVQKVFARLLRRTPLSNDAADDPVQFADGSPFPERESNGDIET